MASHVENPNDNSQMMERSKQNERDCIIPDIAFIIPSYNHQVFGRLGEIDSLFTKQTHAVIVIDDGSEVNLGIGSSNVKIIRHESNLGLAQSLIDGYRNALKTEAPIIVRADADEEYPLAAAPKAIEILKVRTNAGVFVEHRRNVESNGVLDSVFHNVMGFVEGNLLIGQPMSQHSPGLQVYRREVVEAMLPILEKYVTENNAKWGLDLLTIRLASKFGNVVPITLESHKWKERRPLKKIVSQMTGAMRILVTDKTKGFPNF